MPLLTLLEVRAHLRLDPDDLSENDLLGTYTQAALEYVRAFTGQDFPVTTPPDGVELPYSVLAAVLLVVGDLYEHREAQQDVTLYKNRTVENLLWQHRLLF